MATAGIRRTAAKPSKEDLKKQYASAWNDPEVRDQLIKLVGRDTADNQIPILDQTGVFTGQYYDKRLGPPPDAPKQPDPMRYQAHKAYLNEKYGRFIPQQGQPIPEFDPLDPFKSEGLWDSIKNVATASYGSSVTGEGEKALEKLFGAQNPDANLFGLLDTQKMRAWEPNPAERIATSVGGLAWDIPALAAIEAGTGGLGTPAAAARIGAGAAKIVKGAAVFGTYEGARGFFEGYSSGDVEKGLREAGKGLLKGSTLGAGMEIAGLGAPLLSKASGARKAMERVIGAGGTKAVEKTAALAGQTVTLGVLGPELEGRKPTADDIIYSAGFLVSLKAAGLLSKLGKKDWAVLRDKEVKDITQEVADGKELKDVIDERADQIFQSQPERFNRGFLMNAMEQAKKLGGTDKEGKVIKEVRVGSAGDFIVGKDTRALFGPAIDYDVYLTDQIPSRKEGVVAGWFGRRGGKPAIFVNSSLETPGQIGATIIHELGHGVQEGKVRPVMGEKAETSAEKLSNYALSKRESGVAERAAKVEERAKAGWGQRVGKPRSEGVTKIEDLPPASAKIVRALAPESEHAQIYSLPSKERVGTPKQELLYGKNSSGLTIAEVPLRERVKKGKAPKSSATVVDVASGTAQRLARLLSDVLGEYDGIKKSLYVKSEIIDEATKAELAKLGIDASRGRAVKKLERATIVPEKVKAIKEVRERRRKELPGHKIEQTSIDELKKDMTVLAQLPEHKKPHYATIREVVERDKAGKPLKLQIKFTSKMGGREALVNASDVRIPDATLTRRSQAMQLAGLPFEVREQVKSDSAEFDRLLMDNLPKILDTSDSYVSRLIAQTGEQRQSEANSARIELRNMARAKVGDMLGVDNMVADMHARSNNLEKLRAKIEVEGLPQVKADVSRVKGVRGAVEPMQLRGNSDYWSKQMPGLPRKVYEDLAEVSPNDIGAEGARQVQELRKRISATGQTPEEALRGMWGKEFADAPPKLREALRSNLAVPGGPHGSLSQELDPGDMPFRIIQRTGNLKQGELKETLTAEHEAEKSFPEQVRNRFRELKSKAVPAFLIQAKKRGKSEGYQKVVGMTLDLEYTGAALSSHWYEPIMKPMEDMSKESAAQLAEALKGNGTHPLMGVARKIFEEIHTVAKSFKDSLGKIENYYPRILNRDVILPLRKDFTWAAQELEKAIQIYKDSGKGHPSVEWSNMFVMRALAKRSARSLETYQFVGKNFKFVDAASRIKEIRRYLDQQWLGEPSFLAPRRLELPAEYYIEDPRYVIPVYIKQMSQWIAAQHAYGKNFSKLNAILPKLALESREEADLAKRLVSMATGEWDLERTVSERTRKWMERYAGFSVATKIGMGFGTLLNVSQGSISIIPDLGIWNALRGGLDVLSASRRDWAKKTGAVSYYDAQDILSLAGVRPGGWMGRFADRMTKYSGFRGINRGLMYWSALAGKRAIERYAKMAVGDGKMADYARKRLGDFNIDTRKLLPNGTISEAEIQKGAYHFATRSQLQKSVLEDPFIFNDPPFRIMFLFKRFGFRQAIYMKDMIKREVIERRNPMPLVRLAAAGYLGGTASMWAMNQIKTFLGGEPVYDKSDNMGEHLMSTLAHIGAFGMVSDLWRIEKLSKSWDAIKFTIAPVMVSDIEALGKVWTQFTGDWERYGDAWLATKRNIGQPFTLLGSYGRYAGKRLLSSEQQKNREKKFKGDERREIFDLLLQGDADAASNRVANWNRTHKEDPLQMHELSLGELRRYLERKAKTYAEAAAGATPQQMKKIETDRKMKLFKELRDLRSQVDLYQERLRERGNR